jgi:arylsulfatase A-like enzyme
MYRFYFALLIFVISCTGNKQTNQNAAPVAERPNILWIVSEDNSPFIGAYGDTFATTPNIDRMALSSVLYENAFATAPVCAPARSTLITGVYPTAMGTQHMRSTYPIPEFIKFFPRYLREAGYYTTNNAKKDYNAPDQPEAWDESSDKATYKNRKPRQPFFAVFNLQVSHESSLHKPVDSLRHGPSSVPVPPYHPQTPALRNDWAQYYDMIEMMDAQVGDLLRELEEAGLAENTIVFYYSDHGGVLGRSKRFMYESGLHVPLIIRFPDKYRHLAPGAPGTRTDRLVTFADFGPTVLSLANIPAPAYMQGKAFLGAHQTEAREYAFSFRGRMDERIDMVRSARDKTYRYIRNYMPHKIYGQHLEYLWKAPSMRSWEEAYKAGKLNEVQSRFWQTKPAEELYDAVHDPHNIHNLANNPDYQQVLKRMRKANQQWLLETRDVGFIPEAIMLQIAEDKPLYEYARGGEYPLERVMETAEMASFGDPANLPEIVNRLNDPNAVVRYWAATGCSILGQHAAVAAVKLNQLTNDPEVAVRIAAAEALYHIGEKALVLTTLGKALGHENLMARVQALNVLETMGHDAAPLLQKVQALVVENSQNENYDSNAASRLTKQIQKP